MLYHLQETSFSNGEISDRLFRTRAQAEKAQIQRCRHHLSDCGVTLPKDASAAEAFDALREAYDRAQTDYCVVVCPIEIEGDENAPTELTDVGEQYIVPGTERKATEARPQRDLWG